MFPSSIAPKSSTFLSLGDSGRKLEYASRSACPSWTSVATVSWDVFTSVWALAYTSISSGASIFSENTSVSIYYLFCLSGTTVDDTYSSIVPIFT